MVAAAEAEAGGAGGLQEWGTMVAAAEAGGAGGLQKWQAEEEDVLKLYNCKFCGGRLSANEDDACYDARTGTKYNVRTGNRLSPLAVCNSGQFGIKEMSKDENGPWRSPRTDPPTEVKY